MPRKKSDKYQANRNNNNADNSNKKATKIGAKALGAYLGGPLGTRVADSLSKTKLGDKALNKGGEILGKIPGISKATKKLDDDGTLGKLEHAVNLIAAKKNNDSKKEESKKKSSKNIENKTTAKNSNENSDDESNDNVDSKGYGHLKQKNLLFKVSIGISVFIFIMSMGLFTIISSGHEHGKFSTEEEDEENKEGGMCTYKIKGFRIGSNIVKKNIEVSNLKVRLMHSSFCDGTDNVPIEGESLIDFETYILGVVYAEIGGGQNEDHAKAQAIAARSYSLARPTAMNNAAGTKLAKENGQWVLQLRSCVADQVFCNPDKGCSKRGPANDQMHDVYSGVNNPITYKPPLAANSPTRKWVAETAGQVLVDGNGYIINASYVNTDQVAWANLSNNGLSYQQILLQHYNQGSRSYGASDILKASCTTTSSNKTGGYSSWKQYGSPWASIKIGNSNETIKSVGCLATSISMLIAKSGVQTSVNGEFNPGTFVEKLSSNGGFNNALLDWNKVSVAAPNFVYQGDINIHSLSKSEKASKINELLSGGYYIVAEVKGGPGQHWVAIDSINGENVTMMDPGSSSTNMWKEYNWKNTSRLSFFKVL